MSKKLFFVYACFALALLGLSACTPTCDPASLLPPDLVSPGWSEVLDGSAVTLEWSYPDSCQPEQYEIKMFLDPDISSIAHDQLVAGDTTTWTPPTLDLAEEYFWYVRAKVGSSSGHWSSELRSFFTLPYCDAGDLVEPYTLVPENGGIYDRTRWEPLRWEWPLSTCIPEDYRVEISMDPDFVDTTYNGTTGSPETNFYFGSVPPAATQFWWRVSAFVDGTYGPASYPMTFFSNPICAGSALVQPEALLPADDAVVDTGTPEFTWSYTDTSCTPEGFHLLVSYTHDMSHMALEADNPDRAFRSFQAGVPILDCTEYYWQVSVVSEGVESPPSEVHRFVIDTTGSCDCSTGSLSYPIVSSPDWYEILPVADAQLSWYRRGGCIPDGAAVSYYNDEDNFDALVPGPFVTGYAPPDLEPATQYWWKVAYYVDDGGPVLGDSTHWISFLTEPECTDFKNLAAPEQLSPDDRAVVDTLIPTFRITPGESGCIPDAYSLDLQEDPAFSGTNLLGDTSNPSTVVIADYHPLENCTRYYWKVAGIQDGRYGPESETRSFYVDLDGDCPPPGLAGLTKVNTFCRAGTYPEYFPPLHTFETGDPVVAVARNFFNTYLKLVITDKEGNPIQPWVYCWSLLDAFRFDSEDKVFYLPVDNPPPTPIPTPTPIPIPCSPNLGPKDCVAAGGTYYTQNQYCQCP